MSGSGLWAFIVELVGLVIIGAIIFAALDYMDVDTRFKNIAKLAIGGVLVSRVTCCHWWCLGIWRRRCHHHPWGTDRIAITVIVL